MAHRDTPRQARSAEQNNPIDAPIDQMEKIEASIRAKVEHLFRVVKRQLVTSGCAIGARRRTRCSSRRCLRSPTCGWCAINCWQLRDAAPENRRGAVKAVQMACKCVKSGARAQAKRHPSHYLKKAIS